MSHKYGWQHAGIDMSPCYSGLPANALIHRDVWQAPDVGEGMTVVRDRFHSLRPDSEIQTNWIGDTGLAWSFLEGWARLSHGHLSLWLGAFPDSFAPSGLERHPGSRGPLTLTHTAKLSKGAGVQWWVFWCDTAGGWSPPVITLDGEQLVVHSSGTNTKRSFGK